MPKQVPPPAPALEGFLAAYAPHVRALVLRARTLLLQKHPDLTEKLWTGWKMIGYGRGPKMSDFIVGLGPATAHLGVHLAGGIQLDDPEKMLEGTSKSGRHIRITSVDQLDSQPVGRLIDGAFALADAKGRSPDPAGGWERPVSDASVSEKTGRTWDEWIRALDAEGCGTMQHPEIVAVVRDRFDVEPWWQQTVTVGYERAKGLRAVHQTTGGYQVGASKTVDVPLETLWQAWSDTRTRKRWLAESYTVRKATEPKSLRITWHDGSDLQVLFYAKGEAKSQVTVDHRKLPQELVEETKTFWKERLTALKEQVERRTRQQARGGRGR